MWSEFVTQNCNIKNSPEHTYELTMKHSVVVDTEFFELFYIESIDGLLFLAITAIPEQAPLLTAIESYQNIIHTFNHEPARVIIKKPISLIENRPLCSVDVYSLSYLNHLKF